MKNSSHRHPGWLAVWTLMISGVAGAGAREYPLDAVPAVLESAARSNETVSARSPVDRVGPRAIAPFAEHARVEYLLMSGSFAYQSRAGKEMMLRDLPEDVTAVIFVWSESEAERLRSELGSLRPEGKLRFMLLDRSRGTDGFWARDGLPIPVWVEGEGGARELGLVDARYYHLFEPDAVVASRFGAPLLKHDYFHEGGNFMADGRGNCFLVKNRRSVSIADSLFHEVYGCADVTRFENVGGIGHIDEHLRILSESVVATDEPSFKSALEERGYRVVVLPKAGGNYSTYANAVVVNGTLFMPVYGKPADQAAIDAYRAEGFEVRTADSRVLSESGHGSFHCISMTYPKAAMEPDPANPALFLRFRSP